MHKLAIFVVGLALIVLDARASAQSSGSDFGSPSYQTSLDPAWGVQPQAARRTRKYSAFSGVDIGVPVVLDVDRELIRPGANLHLQGGVDLGYFAGFLHGGFRWIPVDFDRADQAGHDTYGGAGRQPLKNPYFGLGIRLQAPNPSRVLPYVSGSFDFNFWNFSETDVACVGYIYWWCNSYDVYRFTPGFSGRAGIAVDLAAGLYIDLGVGMSMSFEGDFFDENMTWMEPYLGVLHRI